MKKSILLILSCILLLSGCGKAAAMDTDIETESESLAPETLSGDVDDVIEITENLFIAQTNDIYINTEDYLGKTIQYEGIFMSDYWEETGTTYFYVIRYGPGCCGYDSNAGFEVAWDGEYPEENDWVEAIGVLEMYEENGYEYLRLQLTSLTVLDERGEEYVSN